MSDPAFLKSLPVPKKPRNAPTDASWSNAEKILGTPLPADWRDFCATYGSFGTIYPAGIAIHNPVDQSGLGLIQMKLERFRKQYEANPDEFIWDAHPAKGGLLPFGGTDQRKEFLLRTEGKPDKWTVVIWDQEQEGADAWFPHKLTFGKFLVALLSGKAVDPFEKGWITEQLDGGTLKLDE
jgi:SMI1-KNR4 cell-wall